MRIKHTKKPMKRNSFSLKLNNPLFQPKGLGLKFHAKMASARVLKYIHFQSMCVYPDPISVQYNHYTTQWSFLQWRIKGSRSIFPLGIFHKSSISYVPIGQLFHW
jgi:hypothetical protein